MGVKTETVVLIGLGAVAVWFLMNQNKTPAPAPTTVYRPPASSSAATTAAEITAGAGIVSTALDDIFSDSSDQSMSGVYNDGEN